MAAPSDHVRRDADAASSAEISVLLGQFRRRAHETAKSNNKLTINAFQEGSAVPFGYGPKVGRLTALRALQEYLPDLQADIKNAETLLALESGAA